MNPRPTPSDCALAAAALFILAFALASGLFWKGEPLGAVEASIWHLDYSLGYTHRGLQGTLFQLVYGKPDMELMRRRHLSAFSSIR